MSTFNTRTELDGARGALTDRWPLLAVDAGQQGRAVEQDLGQPGVGGDVDRQRQLRRRAGEDDFAGRHQTHLVADLRRRRPGQQHDRQQHDGQQDERRERRGRGAAREIPGCRLEHVRFQLWVG
jgi:hypothetical protein